MLGCGKETVYLLCFCHCTLEEMLLLNGYQMIEMNMFKICLLLYTDDIVLFSQTPAGLQIGSNILQEYCNRWKMKVNVGKTKVMLLF